MNDNEVALKSAIKWLCRAQDATSDGGVSAGFSLFGGWRKSYPETSGYIIPTFFEYSKITQEKEYYERAIRIAEWLISIQLECGGFPGGQDTSKDNPIVFNTGQILLGLIRCFQETGNDKYKNAAILAADWLVKIQNKDGTWIEYSLNKIPHTYHSRVSWPLLELNNVYPRRKYVKSAKLNLSWVLKNQIPNGWFNNCSFRANRLPNTHSIAYTIRGLYESGIILKNSGHINASIKAADKVLEIFEEKKFLPASFDRYWISNDNYSILTGNAQFSIIWQKIHSQTKNKRYLDAAEKMINWLSLTQKRQFFIYGIRGGIAGSKPIWGRYQPFTYTNWATKFFADSLIQQCNNF